MLTERPLFGTRTECEPSNNNLHTVCSMILNSEQRTYVFTALFMTMEFKHGTKAVTEVNCTVLLSLL